MNWAEDMRRVRDENRELRFEKSCLWALVILLGALALLHFALRHATI